MVGKGDLMITGQLGDVMRESAIAALSYIRTRANMLHIDPSFQDNTDLHIHLPENGISKDGPSAGITIATALVSALTKRPVRSDLAMTGEVTLLGSVLAIGGLKEKVLAAQQAGISRLIIPAENKKDLAEIPAKIRQRIHFIPVENMDQVIEAALLEAPIEEQGSSNQKGTEIFPLNLDEHIPLLHEQNSRHLSADEEGKAHNNEKTSSSFIIPPSDSAINDIYPQARAKQDDTDH